MEDRFLEILNTLVKPMFPAIAEIEIKRMGLGDFYKVTFLLKDKIENQDAYTMMAETESIFKMLGLSSQGEVIVDFDFYKDE